MTDSKNVSSSDRTPPNDTLSGCSCGQDPFAALPPELRPKAQPAMSGLRKVTCPGCGLTYWTNRATDLCAECEKKGVRLPDADVDREA